MRTAIVAILLLAVAAATLGCEDDSPSTAASAKKRPAVWPSEQAAREARTIEAAVEGVRVALLAESKTMRNARRVEHHARAFLSGNLGQRRRAAGRLNALAPHLAASRRATRDFLASLESRVSPAARYRRSVEAATGRLLAALRAAPRPTRPGALDARLRRLARSVGRNWPAAGARLGRAAAAAG